ncbi:phosphopantothenoylcysteine decarboxylase-like [Corylus avellana]|uniref:phosphopantothenoylcysteine decarboxylase-like n=1 Tax=Corylus avellana TaxID=13451 RepID=UPI001E200326|nr:phosphopantothenoylcysteine decarboxylase-like [Corylus avellana]
MKESGRKQGAPSPCAACKLLRRRCAEDCVFAPYFPADEPQKFANVHKVFGASNVNKMLQIGGGLCDNLLTCIVRAWDYSKPFFVAPAMNTLMWNNPFTERHIMSIDELGISLIPPVTKRLACGDYGNGAMAEPSLIYSTVRLFLESKIQQDGGNTEQLF